MGHEQNTYQLLQRQDVFCKDGRWRRSKRGELSSGSTATVAAGGINTYHHTTTTTNTHQLCSLTFHAHFSSQPQLASLSFRPPNSALLQVSHPLEECCYLLTYSNPSLKESEYQSREVKIPLIVLFNATNPLENFRLFFQEGGMRAYLKVRTTDKLSGDVFVKLWEVSKWGQKLFLGRYLCFCSGGGGGLICLPCHKK